MLTDGTGDNMVMRRSTVVSSHTRMEARPLWWRLKILPEVDEDCINMYVS